MPVTYISQNLKITGGVGNDPDFQASEINLPWRWYYHFPTLPLWIFLLLITFLPKRNRQDRIAPILIIPLIAELTYLILSSNITAHDPIGIDASIYFTASVVMAWPSVWILAPWLSRGNRLMIAAKQFTLILLLGILVLGGYFGFAIPENIFGGKEISLKSWMFFYGGRFWIFASLGLVGTAFFVGLRRSPDRRFRPLLRLLFVLPAVAFGIECIFALLRCYAHFGLSPRILIWYPGYLKHFDSQAYALIGAVCFLYVSIFLIGFRWPNIKKRWLASLSAHDGLVPLGSRTKRLLKIFAVFCGSILILLAITFGFLYAFIALEDGPSKPWYMPGLKELAAKENAATYYRKATDLIPENIRTDEHYIKIREFFRENSLLNVTAPFASGKSTELLAPYQELFPELTDQLHQAAACPDCVWKRDLSQGPFTYKKEEWINVAPMIYFGQLQTLRLAEQQQFDKAIRCWIDTMALIRFETNEALPNDLYDNLFLELRGFAIATNIAPQLTTKQRDRLLHAIDSLPPRKTIKEAIPLYNEAYLLWAKNNPVSSMLNLIRRGRNKPHSAFERIFAGLQYRKIDWQQVESLIADDEKMAVLLERSRKENGQGPQENGQGLQENGQDLTVQLTLTEKAAIRLASQNLADSAYPYELAAENAMKMFKAGLEILDGGDPKVVLKKEAYLSVESKRPFDYKSKGQGFTLTLPIKPGVDKSRPVSMQFGE